MVRTSVCLAVLGTVLLAADADAEVLEQAKAAAFELGQETEGAPRQRSLERMMTGLALATVGARLVWYRFEDKDCREPQGTRCAWAAGTGAAGLAVGMLLMTVLSAPSTAAPSESTTPPSWPATSKPPTGSSTSSTPSSSHPPTDRGLRLLQLPVRSGDTFCPPTTFGSSRL